MGQWCLLLLIASQAALQYSAVEATFGVGLKWLRGDTSLFYSVVNTTTTTATEVAPSHSTLAVVASTTEDDDLDSGRTDLVPSAAAPTVAVPLETAQTTEATTTEVVLQDRGAEPASSTIATTARTITTTTITAATTLAPLSVENATRVSLDDLALEIGKVQDPVLHMVHNEDGSSSYVVVSGRLGSTTVTTTPATTTMATTTTAAATSTIPTTGTTGTPFPASPSYQVLLSYLRPWIFGRFAAASTTTNSSDAASAPATSTPKVTTNAPSTRPTTTSAPVTTPAVDPRLYADDTTLAQRFLSTTGTPVTTSETLADQDALPASTFSDLAGTATTAVPAEFRVTGVNVDPSPTPVTAVSHLFDATVTDSVPPSTDHVIVTTELPIYTRTAKDSKPITVHSTTTAATAGPLDVSAVNSTQFPFRTTATSITAGAQNDSVGRTESRAPATTSTATPSVEVSTAAGVTTLLPPVGDLREDTDPISRTTPQTAVDEPVYRHFYDPSQLTQLI